MEFFSCGNQRFVRRYPNKDPVRLNRTSFSVCLSNQSRTIFAHFPLQYAMHRGDQCCLLIKLLALTDYSSRVDQARDSNADWRNCQSVKKINCRWMQFDAVALTNSPICRSLFLFLSVTCNRDRIFGHAVKRGSIKDYHARLTTTFCSKSLIEHID